MKRDALRALGLVENEVSVYLACLQQGSSSVQDLARMANLNRTSAYDVLKSLERKGFVSYALRSGKLYYQAINPNKLLELLREKELLVKRSLPELNGLYKSTSMKPKVEVFVGKEGLKSVLSEILRDARSILTISSRKNFEKILKFYFPHFVEERQKRNIRARLILDGIPLAKDCEYKIIKKSFKTATWIYKDTIVMVSFEEKEPIGIKIKEKNFANTYKIMFETIWECL